MTRWKTHSKCCTCKEEFLKVDLVDGINCIECDQANKFHKASSGSKIVTKRKSVKCSKCLQMIKTGDQAVLERIELTNGSDYSLYYHTNCVKFN